MSDGRLEFNPDIVWLCAYQRNNKSNGQKNLRCFPNHSDSGHQRGFCGQSILVDYYPSNAKHSTNTPLVLSFANFGMCEEDAEFTIYTLPEQVEGDPIMSKMFKVGEIVQGKDVRKMIRTAESPLRQLLHGKEKEDAQSAVSGKENHKITFEFNRELKGWHYGFLGKKLYRNTWHTFYVYVIEKLDGSECSSLPEDQNDISSKNEEEAEEMRKYSGRFRVVAVISSPKWQLFCRRRNRGPQARARQFCNEMIVLEHKLKQSKKGEVSTDDHPDTTKSSTVKAYTVSSEATPQQLNYQNSDPNKSDLDGRYQHDTNKSCTHLKVENKSNEDVKFQREFYRAHCEPADECITIPENECYKSEFRRLSSQRRLIATGRSGLSIKRHSSGMDGEETVYAVNRLKGRRNTAPENTNSVYTHSIYSSELTPEDCPNKEEKYALEYRNQVDMVCGLLEKVQLPSYYCDEFGNSKVTNLMLRENVTEEMFAENMLQLLMTWPESASNCDFERERNLFEYQEQNFAKFLLSTNEFRFTVTEFIRQNNPGVAPMNSGEVTSFVIGLLTRHYYRFIQEINDSKREVLKQAKTSFLRIPSFSNRSKSENSSPNVKPCVLRIPSVNSMIKSPDQSGRISPCFSDLGDSPNKYFFTNESSNVENGQSENEKCSQHLANLCRVLSKNYSFRDGRKQSGEQKIEKEEGYSQLRICNSISSVCSSAGMSPVKRTAEDGMAELDAFLNSVECVDVLETSF